MNARVLAHGCQALENHGCALFAEFIFVVLALIHALGGSIRVQVEGKPGLREGIFSVWMGGAVGRNASFEFVFSNIALERWLERGESIWTETTHPWAYSVTNN